MSERGCTAVMLFFAAFILGTIAATLLIVSTSGGGGGDPFVGGAMASFALLGGLLGGLVFATIVTALALFYMKKG